MKRFGNASMVGVLAGLCGLLTSPVFGQERHRQLKSPVVAASVTSVWSSSVMPAVATVPKPVDARAERLQDILTRAKEKLDPAALPDLERAKQSLHAALAELENFIDLGSPNGRAWESFLRLGELRHELAKDRPDLAVLTDLHMNMRQNYAGLEYPQFIALRESLDLAARSMRFGQTPDRSMELLRSRMDEVIERLDAPVEGSGIERDSAIGLILSYLHDSQQVSWAVSEIRQEFTHPNIQVYAREEFINRLIGRSVNEPSAVNECLLGTRVIGKACLTGDFYAELAPMSDGVALRLNLNGHMSSVTKGYNRGVVVNSTSAAPILAFKPITIRFDDSAPDALRARADAAHVSADLTSTIHSIEHRLRLVRKIARKKSAQQKPLAECIARGRLERRVGTRYDAQVEQQLDNTRSRLRRVRSEQPVLQRVGIERPLVQLASTEARANGDLTQAAPDQLAAADPPPLAEPGEAGLVVVAHQSAIINALDTGLGGRTIRSQELDNFAHQFLGRVPPELAQEAAGEPWSITMAPFHPVEVIFDDGRVKFVLRISHMTREDQSLADPASITATYVPTYDQGVLRLTREGEVDIRFARITRGIRAVTLRSFLESKFDSVFKTEIVTDRIDLSDRFPDAPDIVVHSIDMDAGWLQVGLR